MANITSAATGNFNNPATWVGGVVPGVGDRAITGAGHIITINVDTTVDAIESTNSGYFVLPDGVTLTANVEGGATLGNNYVLQYSGTTSASIVGNVTNTATSSSTLVIRHNGTGTLNITGNVSLAGSSNSRACVSFTLNGGKLTVTGNVTGSNVSTGSTVISAVNNHVITVNGTVTGGTFAGGVGISLSGTGSTITVNGNVVSAGGGSSANAISTSGATNTVNVNGDVIGNTTGTGTAAISNSGSDYVLTVVGDVYAGSLSSAAGISTNVNGAVTMTITGNVYGSTGSSTTNAHGISIGSGGGSADYAVTINGDITGGINSAAPALDAGVGFYSAVASGILTVNGNLIAGTRTPAVHGLGSLVLNGNATDAANGMNAIALHGKVVLTSPLTHTHQRHAYNGVDVFGDLNNGANVDLVSSNSMTLVDPADVREGLSYAADTLVGTLAVPPAASVSAGVPVDGTVGTGAVVLANVAAVVGAQIAGAWNTP